jgi:RNA-directed DNA polymerase
LVGDEERDSVSLVRVGSWQAVRSIGANPAPRGTTPRTAPFYLGGRPSAKKIQRICAAISEPTNRTWMFLDPHEMFGRLNRILRGWANYFSLGAVNTAYRTVDRHVWFRPRQWLGQGQRVQGSSRSRYSEPYLRRTFKLITLEGRPHRLLWAKA